MQTPTSSVRVIKANPIKINKHADTSRSILKVAAYARVSTDHEEQEDSFERQVNYYTNYIQTNPGWKFVKVYSDPGISGTRAEKRPGFQEMISECRRGNIDRILVKSIARFARNTVDALRYIRELKDLGVSVYFEAQNIDTSTSGGDVLLTILAATAEEESRTISKNVKWAYQKKFQKGEFMLNTKMFLGIDKVDGQYVINEEQAKIVRRIYREYLSGYSISRIVKELNEDGIKTVCGNNWKYGNVKNILTNEKYYGAAYMGKTFKPDVLSKKRYKNNGETDMYYVEDVLPKIISKETFEMVKFEMRRREEEMDVADKTYGKFSSVYPFSKKIRCGCCGSFYNRSNNWRENGKKVPSWWCANHRSNNATCSQKGLSEASIEQAFVKCLNLLYNDIDELRLLVRETLDKLIVDSPKNEMIELDNRLYELQQEMMNLHKKKTNGEITPTEYGKRGQKLSELIDEIKEQKEKLEVETSQKTLAEARIKELTDIIDNIQPTNSFDELTFRRLVDCVVVNERYKLTFKLKIGLEKTIVIE